MLFDFFRLLFVIALQTFGTTANKVKETETLKKNKIQQLQIF